MGSPQSVISKMVWGLAIVIGTMACHSGGHGEQHGFMKHHSIMETLEDARQDSVEYSQQMKMLMEDLKKVLVNVKYDAQDSAKNPLRETFTLQRTHDLTSFPCSNCHNGTPLKTNANEKKAHWNIDLVHGSKAILDCKTCHNTDRPDVLTSISGKAVSFDHSYKVCGQCHSPQLNDWLGGAHGKRVKGWVEPRVINNCVSCHNPHQPAFEPRWPSRFNVTKIKERD